MATHEVYYADGRPSTEHASLAKAKAEVRRSTDAKIIEDFADRTICWPSKKAAENDDGKNAVATIYEIELSE